MATSGNITWDQTRNQILEQSFRKLGVVQEGQTPSAAQYTEGTQALNGVISLLVTKGMPLWKRISLTVPLTATKVYNIVGAVKIAQVVLVLSGGTQYELVERSLYDYNRLPTNSSGTPVHYTFQPKLQDGTLTIWPLPDTGSIANNTLKVVYQKEYEGMINSTDTLDFPPQWILPMVYLTALVLAPEYGVPLQDRQLLEKEAAGFVGMAEGYMDEDGSYFIQPDNQFR